ncbi:unnamed protein product [Tetraodon nigroviridis]|uniref:(spotted green pufferfish) hypothetical protein n=1 Tax=Tetraodon nigroviridis TaxID=99883 RepID=Q4RQN3_TETNG|nr:unnamed protein product [Tetraodon nigroviridis]
MAASGAQKCPKSEKLDEAQALARSCAGRPDFLPCDGLSNCATHSHGKCFKLHWCCHLGWCHLYHVMILDAAAQTSVKELHTRLGVGSLVAHTPETRRSALPEEQIRTQQKTEVEREQLMPEPVIFPPQGAGKYVYQPMTNVCRLPSTAVPPAGAEHSASMDLSISLAERFLKLAPGFQAPPYLESPKYCIISDLFVDDYVVKRINGKMCYVQRSPPPLPELPQPPALSPPALPKSQNPPKGGEAPFTFGQGQRSQNGPLLISIQLRRLGHQRAGAALPGVLRRRERGGRRRAEHRRSLQPRQPLGPRRLFPALAFQIHDRDHRKDGNNCVKDWRGSTVDPSCGWGGQQCPTQTERTPTCPHCYRVV